MIRLGIVEPGSALPPERDLAASFSVSRDTVREAIRSLERRRAGWWRDADGTAARSSASRCQRRQPTRIGHHRIRDRGCARPAFDPRGGRRARPRRPGTSPPPSGTRCGRGCSRRAVRRARGLPPRSTPGCTSRSPSWSACRHWSSLIADNRSQVNCAARRHPAAAPQHRALERAARSGRDRDPHRQARPRRDRRMAGAPRRAPQRTELRGFLSSASAQARASRDLREVLVAGLLRLRLLPRLVESALLREREFAERREPVAEAAWNSAESSSTSAGRRSRGSPRPRHRPTARRPRDSPR